MLLAKRFPDSTFQIGFATSDRKIKTTVGPAVVLSLSLVAMTSLQAADKSNSASNRRSQLSIKLHDQLEIHGGTSAFMLPKDGDFASIPQDPNNPITTDKVDLGKFLFHETAVGTDTPALDRVETYSCATCHHADAGFKSGIAQGIGDGGSGFAKQGSKRRLAKGLNPAADDGDPAKPDFQPVTSPAALNAAYQDVMLWDGALGSRPGSVNASIANFENAGPPGLKVNEFGLSGLETQVLAGTKVHRLRFDSHSILQSNTQYEVLYDAAFPSGTTGAIPEGSSVTPESLGAAKAIAAYERTILANEAPFQKWLHGNKNAMNTNQLNGALLFFGKANCVSCHTGPALSSRIDASENEMFFNVGFNDLDTRKSNVLGTVPEGVTRGRGNFTGKPEHNYKFKIPQLYNLADADVYGHGASFKSVKQVLKYKNNGVPQRRETDNLANEFQPLNLSNKELKDLEDFLLSGLRDPNLDRYQPRQLPSGNCFPAADFKSVADLKCY